MKNHGKEKEAQIARDLVRGVRYRNNGAEANLVARYSNNLWRMLRRKTGDPDLSDDLHQETFGLVLEKIRNGKVGQPEKLAGYIYRTARNLFIAYYRKEARWQPAEKSVEPADSEPDQVTQVERNEEARLVEHVRRFPRTLRRA